MKFRELTLQTNCLLETEKFYREKLGLLIDRRSEDFISFQVGVSKLAFVKTKTIKRPTYHFAFSIPNNKLEESITWLEKKIQIIHLETGPIVKFSNWNARSIYFFDNNGNILEFICRDDLNNYSSDDFSSKSIQSINEVGLVNDSPIEFCEKIISQINTGFYQEGPVSEMFCALGANSGLLVISSSKRNWFPTDQLAQFFPLKLIVNVLDEDQILDFF